MITFTTLFILCIFAFLGGALVLDIFFALYLVADVLIAAAIVAIIIKILSK